MAHTAHCVHRRSFENLKFVPNAGSLDSRALRVHVLARNDTVGQEPANLRRFVHRLAADHRAQHLGSEDFIRGNFRDVAIEHHEISKQSRL